MNVLEVPHMMYNKSVTDLSVEHFESEPIIIEHQSTAEETKLNIYRNLINDYNMILSKSNKLENWDYYKKVVNPYELVYTSNKYHNFPDSVCFIKPLSRSYFKMIEILSITDFFTIIDTHFGNTFQTGHVCEGPGGFIEALIDESNKKKKKVTKSIAMTLYSNKINIPGWKKASIFLKKNNTISLLYGKDNTGDILKVENQDYYIQNVLESGQKLAIFTADGGFDFSSDYTKQEEQIFSLLLASTRIGLEVLEVNGVFILKVFDFYHKSTKDIIYLLSHYFNKWLLYKPQMSRPCNPEHYFIGVGYTGCSPNILLTIRDLCIYNESDDLSHHSKSILNVPYSQDFSDIIESLQYKSFTLQIEYLNKVFTIIDQHNESIINEYLVQNEKKSYEWCIKFGMPIYSYRRHRLEMEQRNDQLDSSPPQ
jgi:23S rRNA U2552 (ribose-2'-O)-methylase RlmE/FtsJ